MDCCIFLQCIVLPVFGSCPFEYKFRVINLHFLVEICLEQPQIIKCSICFVNYMAPINTMPSVNLVLLHTDVCVLLCKTVQHPHCLTNGRLRECDYFIFLEMKSTFPFICIDMIITANSSTVCFRSKTHPHPPTAELHECIFLSILVQFVVLFWFVP